MKWLIFFLLLAGASLAGPLKSRAIKVELGVVVDHLPVSALLERGISTVESGDGWRIVKYDASTDPQWNDYIASSEPVELDADVLRDGPEKRASILAAIETKTARALELAEAARRAAIVAGSVELRKMGKIKDADDALASIGMSKVNGNPGIDP